MIAKPRIKDKKTCIMCGTEKPASDYYAVRYTTKQGKSSVRLEPRCKECARARRKHAHHSNRAAELVKMKVRREKNRDKYLASLNAYRAANRGLILRQRVISEQKRRAAKAGQDDRAMIARVLDEAKIGDKWLDAYTGELIDKPEIDHIVPLTKGGAHSYENLCVTSGFNNRSKNNRSLLVWLATR